MLCGQGWFPIQSVRGGYRTFPSWGQEKIEGGYVHCSYTGTLNVPQCMNLFQDFKFLAGGNRVFSGGVFINWDLKYTFSNILKF